MPEINMIVDENKKEATKHGSFEFPFVIYTTRINNHILGFVDWHWHKELQFCIVTKGKVTFNVNNDSIILSEGEGIFINSGQLHRAENYEDTDSSYLCLDFHPDFISSFIGSVINTKYINPYTENSTIQYCVLKNAIDWQWSILRNLLTIYKEYTSKASGFELQIHILLLETWQIMIRSYFASFSDKEFGDDTSRFKNIINYINNHYMDKIELAELAHEVNLSKSSCCREFKRHMKCTVFEYLINYRLVVSAEFLLKTDDSIADIAYRCGFGSTSYFIEKFKNKTGLSPLAYRRRREPGWIAVIK